MSKYIKLTTTEGLQIGDSVYLPTHGGKKQMIVMNINHEQNTIAAVFHEIYERGQENPEMKEVIQGFASHLMTVTAYYKKHTPKSRAPLISFSQEPSPEKSKMSRTPDMYNFE